MSRTTATSIRLPYGFISLMVSSIGKLEPSLRLPMVSRGRPRIGTGCPAA
jgi:hypothetical protein